MVILTIDPYKGDTENPEGTALDELIETNNLYQLIDEPTNIRGGSMSSTYLVITDKASIFIALGVHPSLDDHCKVIYGKLNVSIPHPPHTKDDMGLSKSQYTGDQECHKRK